MFCNATAFNTRTGCPHVDVDISFPDLRFCTQPTFPEIRTPYLEVPPVQAAPDIASPGGGCIDIVPTTDVNFSGGGLHAAFSLNSGADCASGVYRLEYKLGLECPLAPIAGVVPIVKDSVTLGRLVFNVSGCNVHISGYASCAGGSLFSACIERGANLPIDIPVVFGEDNTFSIVKNGCDIDANIALKNLCFEDIPNYSVHVVSGEWGAAVYPKVSACNLLLLSAVIKRPDPFGLISVVGTGDIGVRKDTVKHKFTIYWKSKHFVRGHRGPRGPSGMSPKVCEKGGHWSCNNDYNPLNKLDDSNALDVDIINPLDEESGGGGNPLGDSDITNPLNGDHSLENPIIDVDIDNPLNDMENGGGGGGGLGTSDNPLVYDDFNPLNMSCFWVYSGDCIQTGLKGPRGTRGCRGPSGHDGELHLVVGSAGYDGSAFLAEGINCSDLTAKYEDSYVNNTPMISLNAIIENNGNVAFVAFSSYLQNFAFVRHRNYAEINIGVIQTRTNTIQCYMIGTC